MPPSSSPHGCPAHALLRQGPPGGRATDAEVPEEGSSVEDYAADLPSRLLGSMELPPEAASVYGLPMTSFRFEWLVTW